jgi:hypothetical protein
MFFRLSAPRPVSSSFCFRNFELTPSIFKKSGRFQDHLLLKCADFRSPLLAARIWMDVGAIVTFSIPFEFLPEVQAEF